MLEVIATTLEDAKRIEQCGADRIELVSALTEGGLTPSYGLIKAVVQAVNIPVNVMIRPHAKHFVYTTDELDIMIQDIEIVKTLGANGVVFGMLSTKTKVNEKQLERLLQACEGLDVTFHKAIDETDVVESIKCLSQYPQVTTILTAGGCKPVMTQIDTLNQMIMYSNHLNILIGGGLTLDNIENLKHKVKTSHFHFGTAVRENQSPFGEINCQVLKELITKLNH